MIQRRDLNAVLKWQRNWFKGFKWLHKGFSDLYDTVNDSVEESKCYIWCSKWIKEFTKIHSNYTIIYLKDSNNTLKDSNVLNDTGNDGFKCYTWYSKWFKE